MLEDEAVPAGGVGEGTLLPWFCLFEPAGALFEGGFEGEGDGGRMLAEEGVQFAGYAIYGDCVSSIGGIGEVVGLRGRPTRTLLDSLLLLCGRAADAIGFFSWAGELEDVADVGRRHRGEVVV